MDGNVGDEPPADLETHGTALIVLTVLIDARRPGRGRDCTGRCRMMSAKPSACATCSPEESVYLNPKYPSTKRTMTTAPTRLETQWAHRAIAAQAMAEAVRASLSACGDPSKILEAIEHPFDGLRCL